MSTVIERQRERKDKEAGERVDEGVCVCVCARIARVSVRELEPDCYGGIRLRKRKKRGTGERSSPLS